MELGRLRYLVAVAEAGTVTEAGLRLRVAQPAVSRQIQQLERELGFQLFERDGRRLRLTAAGRALVPLAQEQIAHGDRIEQAANDLSEGRVRRLVLVAPDASITEVVAPFLAGLTTDDPLVEVRRESPSRIDLALRVGADLVISTEPVHQPFVGRQLIDVPLRAYVSTGHRWAQSQRSAVTVAELVEEPLILLPRGYTTRAVLDHAVMQAGLSYGRVEECSVSHVIQALAASGFGAGVVTDSPHFNAHPLHVEAASGAGPLLLRLHAAWDPRHYGAETIASLVSRLSAHANTDVRHRTPNDDLGSSLR